jgi:hypothetical protein
MSIAQNSIRTMTFRIVWILDIDRIVLNFETAVAKQFQEAVSTIRICRVHHDALYKVSYGLSLSRRILCLATLTQRRDTDTDETGK